MQNSLIEQLTNTLDKKEHWSPQESLDLRINVLTEAFETVLGGVERGWFYENEKRKLEEIPNFILRMRHNTMLFFDDEYTLITCLLAVRNAIGKYEKEAIAYCNTKNSQYKYSHEIYNKAFSLFSDYIGAAFDQSNYNQLLNRVVSGQSIWQKA